MLLISDILAIIHAPAIVLLSLQVDKLVQILICFLGLLPKIQHLLHSHLIRLKLTHS